MAQIDADVASLLAGLDRSPFSWMADRARASVDDDIEAQWQRRTVPIEVAFRQLAVVEAAVASLVEAELSVSLALRERAHSFKIRTIAVVPSATAVIDGRPLEHVQKADQLLGDARFKALESFLKVWGKAAAEIRNELEQRIDG